MGHLKRFLVGVLAFTAIVVPALPSWAGFSDVSSTHWAAPAIQYVAVDRTWMRDSGPTYFRPDAYLTRKALAHAIVKAFAPPEPDPTPTPEASGSPDPSPSPSPEPTPPPAPNLTFSDLAATDPYYPFANAAVKLGWMRAPGGAFRPEGTVAKHELDYALTFALGLKEELVGLTKIGTADGYLFKRPTGFGPMLLARELRLHYNHPTGYETREMYPWSAVRRGAAAYALHRAALAAGSWRLQSLSRYRSVTLPVMNDARKKAIEFALQFVGYPYVWAGEWYRPTPSGYCCGTQTMGGFDCSGFTWWVMKAPTTGFDNSRIRGYRGWSLPQRTSYDMAKAAPVRIAYDKMYPMDLMFFQSELSRTDWPAIDHVGMYAGRGWMVHSSGGYDGVTLSWVGDGWWRDHFRWARRIV